ncbi:MAG: hypothetical protein ABL887_00325, partial [Nitrosomonas sp.]
FSKEMTKKYRDTHKKIRNCNEFDNSLNFAKVSSNIKKSVLYSVILCNLMHFVGSLQELGVILYQNSNNRVFLERIEFLKFRGFIFWKQT